METVHYTDNMSYGSGSQGPSADYCHLMAELKAQNFDVMKFSSYRTACKLRFIQKRISLHLVDIWNVIEAFRENGLNSLEPRMEISIPRLETLVTSIYFQLNKRLPSTQQIDLDQCTTLLLNWLMSAYDPEDTGKVRVFSIKIALATMCSGKLMDKLRYIFSLICDNNGLLVQSKFADFLREILQVPCSVHESPTFGYRDNLPTSIIDGQSKVTVNDFLDIIMSDPAPPCLVWLPLLHRLASVENVLHPVQCDGCNREAFLGFRYRCQKCYNYQLCQDCFWRGRVSGSHTSQHEMKEYTYYKSPSKQLGHSLKKSFRCVPEKQISDIPRFPEEPEKTLNLQHIVPPSPIPSHNGFHDAANNSFDMSSIDGRSTTRSLESSRGDDEHRLIARYAARLADTRSTLRSPSDLSLNMDTTRQRDLIAQLEAKNREIMREIVRLRKQQEQEDAAMQNEQNPTLLAELRALRQRKEELESHLSTLQESRRELMVQLEALMKMLKNHQTSPRSTPNSSPRSATSKSPPLSTPYPLSSSRSAPTTPGSNPPTSESATGAPNNVIMAYDQSGSTRSLRNDLLVAADSVTNAMSSLVRELNSGSEDEDGGNDSKVLSSSREDTESAVESLEGGGTLWREERQRAQENHFLQEIHARNNSSTSGHHNDNTIQEEDDQELYDNDPRDLDLFQHHASLTTDDESYVRTDDDEDGGNTDWEETMRRWVNR
ncbi:dystrobrevin beta-like isoform X2 [Stegodyphus dumicola]|uniref:dystrobrevin beta-like isoform X2 n=1 Tax=Stegodyphus dumicola TaxID=202533 RepID=UPI0015A9D624|nr:dystrobrevin beta-like isoform X2 [Stegodyphus dumicola]